MTESADTVAPKRTKALPVATEREQWQAKVTQLQVARDACLARIEQLSRQRFWIPVALVAGMLLGWAL